MKKTMFNKKNKLTLIEQIDQWTESDEHDKIVDAINALPKDQIDYEMTGLLARALNNLDRYEEALQLLIQTSSEGQNDTRWHYRKGYSLYYLEKYDEAKECFTKSLELSPDDEDSEQFIRACDSQFIEEASKKPFTQRVDEFWELFIKEDEKLRSMLDIKDDESRERTIEFINSLLSTAFQESYFEYGYNGEKYELILTAEGMKHSLFKLDYWKKQAHQQLLKNWNFIVGRQADIFNDAFNINMYGLSLSADTIYIYPQIKENDQIDIKVYCEDLLELLAEDEGKAYVIISIMLDHCIGELLSINVISDMEILDRDDDENGNRISLSNLLNYILENSSKTEEELQDPCSFYTVYQIKNKEECVSFRDDVFVGNTCLTSILNEFYSGDTEIYNENAVDGVIFGFFAYDNSAIEKNQMINFRAEIEDKIKEKCNNGVVFGSATGHFYSYIDCICFDKDNFLKEVTEILSNQGLTDFYFSQFKQNGRVINLSKQD